MLTKNVCSDCFDEEFLQQLVRDNAATSRCDYCDTTADEVLGDKDALIAAPLKVVMKAIEEGLSWGWNNADDEGITYETAEGGYQANIYDTYDLVQDFVCPNNDDLRDDIVKALPDQPWVSRDFWSLDRNQRLWSGWQAFRDLVKHHNRYMFNVTRAAEQPALDELEEGIAASRMLDEIGDAIGEVGLIRPLPASSQLFRGRIGPPRAPFKSASKLGPPPPHKAVYANRMSPAGIPMFYGAFDEYTAIRETVVGRLKSGEAVNVGKFITLEEFLVLDLTRLPQIPSLFSDDRYLRPVLMFLRSFVRDLSRPIKKDGREHIEYVPTQIVTEYFRHSFGSGTGGIVRGILYPSSKAKDGTACVLFFEREECGVKPTRDTIRPARKQWLRFVKGSANIYYRVPRKRPFVLT